LDYDPENGCGQSYFNGRLAFLTLKDVGSLLRNFVQPEEIKGKHKNYNTSDIILASIIVRHYFSKLIFRRYLLLHSLIVDETSNFISCHKTIIIIIKRIDVVFNQRCLWMLSMSHKIFILFSEIENFSRDAARAS